MRFSTPLKPRWRLRNLLNFLNRMSGYNKNSVKMNVLGSSSANNGDVVQVDLPTNSIVDLSSLAWSFDVEWFADGLARDGAAAAPVYDETVSEGPKLNMCPMCVWHLHMYATGAGRPTAINHPTTRYARRFRNFRHGAPRHNSA